MRTSTLAVNFALLLIAAPASADKVHKSEFHRADGMEDRAGDTEEEVIRRSTRFYLAGATWGHLRDLDSGGDGYRTFVGMGLGLAYPISSRSAVADVEMRLGLSEADNTAVTLGLRLRPELKSGFQAGGLVRYYWDTHDVFDLLDHGIGVGGSIMYTLTRVQRDTIRGEKPSLSAVVDLTLGGNHSTVPDTSKWTPGASLAVHYRF